MVAKHRKRLKLSEKQTKKGKKRGKIIWKTLKNLVSLQLEN
jgi:hypothetical protein